jgi:hypothetical protein
MDPKGLPKFDPTFHPIGYALAVEVLADQAPTPSEGQASQPAEHRPGDGRDRFGWELQARPGQRFTSRFSCWASYRRRLPIPA